MMVSLGQKRLRPVTVIATEVYVVVCSRRNENLQRRTVGRHCLRQTRRPALPLAQPLKRQTAVVLRRRPVERHPLARSITSLSLILAGQLVADPHNMLRRHPLA
jgi:hypothetical protein